MHVRNDVAMTKERKVPRGRGIRDLTGERFGRLLVVGFAGRNNHNKTMWQCQCDCGATPVVIGETMTKIKQPTRSCGCFSRDRASRRSPNWQHGDSRLPNGKRAPTYETWLGMIARCYKQSTRGFENYGGRGISVCDRWRDSYEAFLADMGPRPDGKTLDRINPNGNYEPGNCRWATRTEQQNNLRLSACRVREVLASHESEAPGVIAALRRELLGDRA